MRQRLLSRWRAIKRSRANVALVVAGALLILMSPIWRLAVAPALKVVANDFDSIYFYDGILTTYVAPPGQPAIGVAPNVTSVVVEQRLLGRPDLSSPRISAVEENVRVLMSSTGRELSRSQHIYTVDRRTGELVASPAAASRRTGYYVVFPFDTPRAALPYWVEPIEKAITARFAGGTKINGLPVYQFAIEYHNQSVPPPSGYPTRAGAGLVKALLGTPLPAADTDTVVMSYIAAGHADVFVEPRSGTPVDRRGVDEAVSVAVTVAGKGTPSVTRLLYSLSYSASNASVQDAVSLARDEIAKLRLQFVYIPLGFLLFGIAVFAVGAFAGIGFLRKTGGRA